MTSKVHLGPYQLTEQIAKSDIATSWGVNVSTRAGAERMAALKVLNPAITDAVGFADRLIEQVRLAEQLSHVNLAQTWDFGRRDGVFYLLLEFVEGVPLSVIMKEGPVPTSIAVHIALEIASGLSYAHARRDKKGAALGVVHGDVRPRNILVSSSGAVKIVDFGVARARKINGEDPVPVAQREVDLFAYADPRHARGEEPTVASDTFSVLALLWSMLAGRRLFEGNTYTAVKAAAERGEIPAIASVVPDVDEALAAIIDRGLDIANPDRALSTASGVRNALTEWQRSNDPGFGRHLVKEHYKALLQEPISTRRTRPLTRREFTPDDTGSVIFKPEDGLADAGSSFDLKAVFRGFDPLNEDSFESEATILLSPSNLPIHPPTVDEEDVELLDDDLIESIDEIDVAPASARPSALGLAAALAAKKSNAPAPSAPKPSGLAAALAAKKVETPPAPAAPKPSGLAAALASKKTELPPADEPKRSLSSLPPVGANAPAAKPPVSTGPPVAPAAPPPAPRGNTQVIAPVDIEEDDLLSSLVDSKPAAKPAGDSAAAALAALSRFAETGPIDQIDDDEPETTTVPFRGFVADTSRLPDDDFTSEPTVAGKAAISSRGIFGQSASTPSAPAVEPAPRVVPSILEPKSEPVSSREVHDTPIGMTPAVPAAAIVASNVATPTPKSSFGSSSTMESGPSASRLAGPDTSARTKISSVDGDSLAREVWDDEKFVENSHAWEDDYDADEGLPTKKSKMPMIIGLIVALLVLGGGAYYFATSNGTDQSAAAVASGLRVTSTPAGARIFINDQDSGFLTPRTFTDIAVGESVRIRAELDGYEPSMPITAQVSQGTIGDIALTLHAIPHVLQIASNPSGATVYVDGVEVGTTPMTTQPLTSNGALGVNVSIQMNGYAPQAVQHTWAPGQRNGSLSMTLERAPRRR